ncbi:MAG: MBL fold metallo-hydrolase [Bacteroidota bacterium]
MHRRNFIRNTSLVSAAALFGGEKAIASFFKTNAHNIKMLRGNVGIFTERGGTIGFYLGKDGVAIIDSQFADTAPHLIDELKNKNAGPLKFLLNTHHHGDHSGGNIAFKGMVDHVIAHKNSLVNQTAATTKNNTLDKQLLPDLTFTKKYKLKLGDEKLKADYYGPAHTNGDAVYHFEEANVFHTGDLMFNKRHPFVDRTTGASISNWIKVLYKIGRKATNDSIIIFGHALVPGEETGTKEDVKKFQDYLTKLLAFTEAAIKKGVTKEDFIKNTVIPGVTEWSGQGIERPLGAAYDELVEKKN